MNISRHLPEYSENNLLKLQQKLEANYTALAKLSEIPNSYLSVEQTGSKEDSIFAVYQNTLTNSVFMIMPAIKSNVYTDKEHIYEKFDELLKSTDEYLMSLPIGDQSLILNEIVKKMQEAKKALRGLAELKKGEFEKLPLYLKTLSRAIKNAKKIDEVNSYLKESNLVLKNHKGSLSLLLESAPILKFEYSLLKGFTPVQIKEGGDNFSVDHEIINKIQKKINDRLPVSEINNQYLSNLNLNLIETKSGFLLTQREKVCEFDGLYFNPHKIKDLHKINLVEISKKIIKLKSDFDKQETVADLKLKSEELGFHLEKRHGVVSLSRQNGKPVFSFDGQNLVLHDKEMEDLQFIYHVMKFYHIGDKVIFDAFLNINQKSNHFIDHLIKLGLNINAKDKNGETAVLSAVRSGNLSLIDALHLHQADFSIADNEGNSPLLIAVKAGNVEIVEYILNQIDPTLIDVNQSNHAGEVPLLAAVQGKNKQIAELLLKNEASIQIPDENGDTPLIAAVKNNDLSMVKMLIQYSNKYNLIDFDHDDREKNNSLMIAIKNGELEIVDFLLKHHRFDYDKRNDQGETLVTLALKSGYLNLAKEFIEQTVDLSLPNLEGETPLSIAIDKNYFDVVEHLLEVSKGYKRDIAAKRLDKNGHTPLLQALLNGHYKIAGFLQENFIDFNQEQPELVEHCLEISDKIEGETPLMWAAREGKVELVELFLMNGCDVNHQHVLDGETALIKAIKENRLNTKENRLNTIDILLERSDPKVQDSSGNTALMWAIKKEEAKAVIQHLINHSDKASINLVNKEGDTPLILALNKQWSDHTASLFAHDANIFIPNAKGQTPLMLAITNDLKEIVAYFLTTGISGIPVNEKLNYLNAQDAKGNTALIYAVKHKNPQAIIKLMENWADPDIVDNKGKKAKDFAQGDSVIESILENRSSDINEEGITFTVL